MKVGYGENRKPAMQRNVEMSIALPMHSLKLCIGRESGPTGNRQCVA